MGIRTTADKGPEVCNIDLFLTSDGHAKFGTDLFIILLTKIRNEQ
jgi:hypothetical protein